MNSFATALRFMEKRSYSDDMVSGDCDVTVKIDMEMRYSRRPFREDYIHEYMCY